MNKRERVKRRVARVAKVVAEKHAAWVLAESVRALDELASGMSLSTYLSMKQSLVEWPNSFLRRVEFFDNTDNAPSLSLSVRYALAELFVEHQGWRSGWEDDQDARNDLTKEEAEGVTDVLWVWLTNGHGKPLGSLGGVINSDMNQRRVIEAELALEAMAKAEYGQP